MLEYKGTEKFDIGRRHGELEYDFFAINDENDFGALIIHYGAIYKRFNLFLDGYKKIENNTNLSPVVQEKMKKYNANICLAFLGKVNLGINASIRQMVVNELKPNGTYETYFFYYYYFCTGAREQYGRGLAYSKSGLYNAAIKHFSYALELDHGMASSFLHRGLSYLHQENYDKAIEDFTQAIKFNLEHSFTYRGIAYLESGDLEKAKADFSMALELDPDNEIAKKYLENN